MENALEDFMHHCRIERRLAPLTCSAYERDVTACMGFRKPQERVGRCFRQTCVA
jgi:site-specific recombinase XerD